MPDVIFQELMAPKLNLAHGLDKPMSKDKTRTKLIGDTHLPFDVEVLDEMRKSGQLCDIVLLPNDAKTEFHVHGALLAGCSGYFRNLFTKRWMFGDKQRINVPEATTEMLALIINYAYSNRPCVTSKNVEKLLPIARDINYPGLLEECCIFLEGMLAPTNCVGIEKFAAYYECPNLKEKARQFLLVNFHEVARDSNELLTLSYSEIESLISSSHLNAYCEEEVFEVVTRWVEYDYFKRQSRLHDLLKHVRLGLIQTDYFFEKIFRRTIILENLHMLPCIHEAWDFICDLDRNGNQNVDLEQPLVKPRIPNDVLFCIGGWSGGGPITAFETYDTRADRWFRKNKYEDTSARAYHAVVTINNKIYVIGGFDGTSYFSSVRCFDPVEKCWSDTAPMHQARCYVAAAILNKMIYCCGGYNGRARMATVEHWNPATNQWTLVGNMNQKRSDASADSFNDVLYVAGGFDGDNCLNSLEMYEPAFNQWTTLTPMQKRRSGLSVVTFDGEIYALGGFDGVRRMSCGERFNPSSQTWTDIPPMYTARSNFAAVILDGMIFVIGGFNGSYTIPHVECFDSTSEQWYDATDMHVNRSAVSACVIRNPASIAEFTYYGNMKQSARSGNSLNLSKSNSSNAECPLIENPGAILADVFSTHNYAEHDDAANGDNAGDDGATGDDRAEVDATSEQMEQDISNDGNQGDDTVPHDENNNPVIEPSNVREVVEMDDNV
ncbi:unnamed protein product [Owenia fusiformis]|uniref:BTB domain-containing protein n=1 Tax=Owenia fusiformis TaxID=6347 RepID=A0A8S4NRL7_OWEFU|nr:unnamed protein product [Owenia fusiformis]